MGQIIFLDFVNSNIEKYMKEQNHKMLVAFRNIKSEYIYEKEKTHSVDEDIIKKMFNKRKETCIIYKDKNQNLFEDENREMIILHPFIPVGVSEEIVLKFLQTLPIEKIKGNFKLFQDACQKEFGVKMNSSVLLKYINS